MGVRYLWDTNIAIYFLQNKFPAGAEKFIDQVLAEYTPCISAITEIELLCWNAAAEKDLLVIRNFINNCLVIDLDQPIKNRTAELRKLHKIKLPDAIIGATSLVYNLVLISRNVDDFKAIEGLDLIDPFAL